MFSCKPTFSLSSFTFIKRLFSSKTVFQGQRPETAESLVVLKKQAAGGGADGGLLELKAAPLGTELGQ